MRTILSPWLDQLEESFSYKEVQFKRFGPRKPAALMLKTLMKPLQSLINWELSDGSVGGRGLYPW